MFIVGKNTRLGKRKKRKRKGSWEGERDILVDPLLTLLYTSGIYTLDSRVYEKPGVKSGLCHFMV